MSTNSISLIYPGGSVSQEHLESMSNTALAVQQIVKAKGTARRNNIAKDRVPTWIHTDTRQCHKVVQIPDPANMAKRYRVEIFEMPEYRIGDLVFHEAETWETEYETTWHSQFVQTVGHGYGQVGSKNNRKADRASKRQSRIENRKRRKATAKKDRPSQYDLKVEALHDDFGGQYPFRITTPQSGCKVDDLLLRSVTEANQPKAAVTVTVNITVPEETLNDDEVKSLKALRSRTAKAEAKRQADLAAKRSHWAGVYQRPEAEAMASPTKRERDEYFYGSRRFLVANTRGA